MTSPPDIDSNSTGTVIVPSGIAGGAAPGDSAHSISPMPESDVPGVVRALFSAVLGSLDNGKFYATELVSSPLASQSDSASRSLPGLAKSSELMSYLPYLLAATSPSIRQRLALSSASYVAGGFVRTDGHS